MQTQRRDGHQPLDQASRLGLQVHQKQMSTFTVHIHHTVDKSPRKAERHRITQRIRCERNLTVLHFIAVKCRTHSNVKKHKSRRSSAG